MDRATLTIDGRDVTVSAEATILDAAAELGIELPTLCYHSMLVPFTSCWICVVEWKERRKLVPSCSTRVAPGMTIETNNERVRTTRRLCLELLLSDHCGDCEGACRVACPAGCDVQGYLTHIANGNDLAAIEVIKQTIALPAALGRICPHPCETACRRQRVEEPVAICALKRFAADIDLNNERPFRPAVAPETGKRVAIVGAGPAGLACAYHLRQKGHSVTVFDARSEPGGMLRYGIPEFRMPRDVLAKEIHQIADLGVAFRFGHRLGEDLSIEGLKADGFDVIFIAIGAWRSSMLRCEGEDNSRVLHGIHFLERVAKGERVTLGRRVMVVGGGNTAMDACRTAIRLDAEDVTVLYRRTRQEMPANPPEIDAAIHEGVDIQYLAAPTRITPSDDGLRVTCIRMELGEPDASGRRRPVPIQGSEFEVVVDTLIAAIGQGVKGEDLAETSLALDRWNCVEVNPQTLETSIAGVFAGGDCVTGPGIAVEAVAAGRLAAIAMDRCLHHGKGVRYLLPERPEGCCAQKVPDTFSDPLRQFTAQMGTLEEIPEEKFADVERVPRATMPEIAPERLHTFEEVEKGFDEPAARREAARCLICGCDAREDCKLRRYATEYGVNPERLAGEHRTFELDDSHEKLAIELGKCIDCGNCIRVCRDEKGLEVLTFAGRGFSTRVTPTFGRPLAATACDGCLKCVEVCPTGAIFAKLKAAGMETDESQAAET